MRPASRFALVWGICLFLVLNDQAGGQTPPLILTGSPGDRLGVAVANAGDVNGDGSDDLIIGADHYFGNKIGEAKIFFGGIPHDFTADVVLSRGAGGWAVAGAGDVNGDGYDDVLVNANSAVYLYFGGAPMDTTPDAVIPPVPSTTFFGLEVAGAGDVNNDGYDDYIITSVAEEGIFVYFGSPVPGTTPDLALRGASRASSAGDINKDGYDDIITGFPAPPPDQSYAYLYFGGAPMDTIPDLILGTGLGDLFGSSVAGGGDLNGDGWPDLIVCAAGDQTGGVNAGRAYVYFGGATLDTIPDFTYAGSGTNNLLGYKEAGFLGDINSDGYDDFFVSSDVETNPFAGKMGKVHIFRGGPDITNDTTLVGEDSRGNFGWSVASIDFDREGEVEIFIGASYAPYPLKSGKVYLYEPPVVSPWDFWKEIGDLHSGGVWSLTVDNEERIFALTDSGLFRSTNAGQVWDRLDVISAGRYGSGPVAVAPSGDVFTPHSGGMGVWHSTDHGDTWVLRAPNYSAPRDMISHPSGALLYRANSGIYRSTDNGVNWDSLSAVGWGNSLATDSAGNIFAIGGDEAFSPETCRVSTDIGESWVPKGSLPMVVPMCCEVYDLIVSKTGKLIAATDEMGVYSSTDAGMTWTRLSIPFHIHNSSFALDTDGNIFYGIPGVGVLKSDGDFDTWSIINAGLSGSSVMSLASSSSGYLYVGTAGGTVFRSVNPTVSSVEERSNNGPGLFLLEQNYPNPFNPVTKIQFTIVNRQSTIVKVFDLLGREVATLVNEVKEPGRYEVEFDAAGLSSGIYFYRLEAGAFMETRKLVLLR